MSKYKYYFRKPRSEIAKDVFKWLAVSGMVYIAASSPYFVLNLWKSSKEFRKYKRKKVYNTFYNLQRAGYIDIGKRNNQFYFALTEKGKKKAGWLQIDSLEVKRPKKWDRKWRIVMFDIAQIKKFYRELFRGKLKELGFYPLQKSVWVIPFNCSDEIELLKDFFGLSEKEVKLVVATDIGNDARLRKNFKI